jgi:hypothetical protein
MTSPSSASHALRTACALGALVLACATGAAACGGSSDPTPNDATWQDSLDQVETGPVVDTTATLSCSQGPQGGEPCGAEPPDTLCRQHSCTGGCEMSCACCQGRWVCSPTCVDALHGTPVDAGTSDQAPLCQAKDAVEMICLHGAP